MKHESLLRLNLQLFAEDGSVGGAADTGNAGAAETGSAQAAAPSAGNEAEGVSALPQREGRRQNIFPRVPKVDVQPAQQRTNAARQFPTAQPQAAQPTEQPQAETWEQVKKRYKDEYGADVRAAINDRFKNQEDQSKRLSSAMETLAAIAPFYGIQADEAGSFDLEKLGEAIKNDRRWYEQSALEKGIPVETEMHIRQLEMEQKRREQEARQSLEQEMLRNHLANLRQQEQQMREEFPDFDLMGEIRSNPAFARMTGPDGGFSVRQAYFALHGDELMHRQSAATEERTKQTMSRAIQAGSVRPSENGIAATGGGIPAKDYTRMTRADWQDIRNRARRGEKIAIG